MLRAGKVLNPLVVVCHDCFFFYLMSQIRDNSKTEYEILSGLPQHKNVIKLFAFFYDRPKAHPKLRNCGEGMALCMLMEQLSRNMQEHISTLKRGNGPTVNFNRTCSLFDALH